ncbi:MAG TPA: Rieske 2Fe-2S domain-containing protein [Stellaceae bacterium]|nr:Rieske 2Fe-2S domain-containing protein [Stellaceae bacterium]
MLKREQNERLVRVGAGTPAGNLFRRYWQPALLSEELPEKDGAPQRVRMFGEDLVAFRDSNGRVGLVDAYCPHRRAPLFFGRNEECGLRCVYHGWKFDADGHCVDLPSEPETSPMKSRVTIKAYPTFEAGGMVWAYLGPSDKMPAKPDYEWMRVPATHRHVTKTFEDCNYLQALEGGLDTAHSSFLHNLRLGDNRLLRNRDGAPRIDVETTEYGYTYISTRKASEQDAYVRVYHYVMPFQQMRGNVTARVGGRAEFPRLDGHLWVPVDDEHTCVYNWAYSYDRSTPFTPDFIRFIDADYGRGEEDLIPGTYRLKRNLANDYMIDRVMQKTVNSTGIVGVNTQDFAVQEGMGPIVDRSLENLGTSDRPIVTMRRLLLEAVDAVERGGDPPALDPKSHRAIRAHDGVVPKGDNWRDAFAAGLAAKW